MRYLVTGTAGFIGFHLARLLLERGEEVYGYDSVNDYYNPLLKEARLAVLSKYPNYRFARKNLCDAESVNSVFKEFQPEVAVNLAAQAGVRYSLENPQAYIDSNITGFLNILEACRHSYDGGEAGVQHLVYASSSSVYGGNFIVIFPP